MIDNTLGKQGDAQWATIPKLGTDGMSASSRRISAYFSHLVSYLEPERDVYCLAIAHMVPNTVLFGSAVDQLVTLSGILAKPKSVQRPEHTLLSQRFPMPDLSREWANDATAVVDTLYQLKLSGKRLILIDIGGYFANSVDLIAEKFDGELLGVMEGTENGVMKYEQHEAYNTPIITVARSPLKLPEDHLVASSVVFSIEAVLRDQAEILQTRTSAVIGYGRVGSSVAEILRNRGINTVVYDKDPMKLAEAAARGFQANTSLYDALSGVSLVVCATGNSALDLRGFGTLASGCVVASVTSADDELNLDCLKRGYDRSEVNSNLTRYEENRPGGRHFYLIADGNAANFIHGAVIGPAIQLIEGEKLMALKALIDQKVKQKTKGLAELSNDERREVAKIWIEHFL